MGLSVRTKYSSPVICFVLCISRCTLISMKKVATKVVKKNKENDFDTLARLVEDGFERVENRFDEIDKRFESIDRRFESVDSRLFSIDHELKDHTRRLDSIERKQSGALTNLDETVHRSEFKILAKRVDILEKKSSRK